MDKNYILSSFLLTMSCTTTALGVTNLADSYNICPEVSVEIPLEATQSYILSSTINSCLESLSANGDIEDFNKLVAFGEKFLQNEVGIEDNIQKIISDNFWDML